MDTIALTDVDSDPSVEIILKIVWPDRDKLKKSYADIPADRDAKNPLYQKYARASRADR